jgi:hypothetical protein
MTATATRATKSETITRAIAMTLLADGSISACVAEFRERKSGAKKAVMDSYLLRPIPCDIGGTAVEVEKSGSDEVHHVRLGEYGGECDCKWGTYKSNVKPCRHVEMIQRAIAEGKLASAPQETKQDRCPECGRDYRECSCWDSF